jgi:hypothetical protein
VLERSEQTASAPQQKVSVLYSLPGVIGVVLVYSALHITARLFASFNLGEDDPLDAILTQTLAFGYYPGHPPLYDWVLWLLAQVLGPGALRFQLLKYGLLTATCGFVFLSARRVMKGNAVWALLSVEALALIYQISWRFHEGFTHAVGAMCAVAATFWALTRLVERERTKDYVLLGVCIGLGVLTVATYWIFLAALIGAAMLQPTIRRLVIERRIALTIVVAVLIAMPHYVWLAFTSEGLGAMLPSISAGSYNWHAVVQGMRRAITEPVMYLSPLIFLYPLFFPRFLPNLRVVAFAPNRANEPDFEQLILHLTMLSFGALLLGALLYGINRYPVHALMPLFLITSIWLTAQARKAARSIGELRRFAIMALSVAIFAFCARAANMYVLEPVCKLCRWGIPYAELANDIRKAGFEKGQIVVYDAELGGNLVRFFPKAVIALGGSKPYAVFSKGIGLADKLYVWDGKEKTDNAAQQFFASGKIHDSVKELSEALQKAQLISIPWRNHLWKPDGYRQSRWYISLFHEEWTYFGN